MYISPCCILTYNNKLSFGLSFLYITKTKYTILNINQL